MSPPFHATSSPTAKKQSMSARKNSPGLLMTKTVSWSGGDPSLREWNIARGLLEAAERQPESFVSFVNKTLIVFQPLFQDAPTVIMAAPKCLTACIFFAAMPYMAAVMSLVIAPVMVVSDFSPKMRAG